MLKKKKHTDKRLAWFDQHLLELVAGFLLAFLPLYPKWPLFDVLPGYIVRVRLEDFVILAALIIYLIQVLRKKAKLLHTPIFLPIIIYWSIGLISSLSAIFITHTVPAELAHVGKLFLHWFRRIEYMSLAFIFFSAIRTKKSLVRITIIFITTILLISLYGYGQKYLAWPVYSTMNREFAKGWRLILTENARVSSTFAGHYDLAAFTVIALSFLGPLLVILKSKAFKALLWIIFILIYGTLLLTASRTSFIAYLGAINLLFLLMLLKLGYKRVLNSWISIFLISIIGFTSFGSLSSRFSHFRVVERVDVFVSNLLSRIKPPYKPTKFIEISSDLQLVYTDTDTPPSPISLPTDSNLPPDVYEAIPLNFPEASLAAIPATSGTGSEGKARDYSQSAYNYGLSGAIRFDALWPRALQGFKTNPLLGSGYSTLTKVENTDFTEAESTDNDYLRALGETGLLGLLSFFGIVVIALAKSFQGLRRTQEPLYIILLTASISILVGMLINALYIDIFEASKVAYTVWAFIGITFAVQTLTIQTPKHEKT